ncbi:MAG: recombinase family protein [Ruminococcus flavefaciens]|nr:recombinase family protein [Ruminococcus flavefaciens]MCM1362999.1 recombinase family protein [Clostridiales bacterium]
MYGYKIINGKAIVDEREAEIIINIFNGYLSGMSLRNAAIQAGRPMVHSMVKNIIRNFCYVGDEFYPAIISRQTFSRANAELIHRSEKHSNKKRLQPPPIYTEFDISEPEMHFDSPIKQAEYIYSLIEVRK